MKVAFLIDNPRVIGGGDYALFKYAEQLSLLGHEVSVYGQFYNEFMDQIAAGPNFHMTLRRGLPSGWKGAGRVNRLWDKLYTRSRVKPRLSSEEGRPDWLVGYHRASAVKAVQLGRSLGIPVANVVFESPEWMLRVLGEPYRQVYQGALKAEWARVREAYRNSHLLVPLSNIVREEVEIWVERPVADPIYCGVSDPGESSDDQGNGEYLLYLGRLDVNKNVHEIIDAASQVSNCPPLVIAGTGYEESDLRMRAQERGIACEFRGHVTDEEKWKLIRGCRMMVFPTSFEGFGIPPAEALVCRKPCICSDIPILREVYGDHVEWVPEHDVPALAHSIQQLLQDSVYCFERGEKGRDFILKNYTWAKSAQRMERELTKVWNK